MSVSIILANIMSGIGMLLLVYSTFSKSKKKMLWIQVGDCFFNALGCLLAGSYSAMITNTVSMIRNILNAKGFMTKVLSYIVAVILLVLGVVVNKKGLIGLLPPVASVIYTIWLERGKTAQSLRFGLIVNLVLWLIHDFYVGLYVSGITDILLIIVTVINIIRFRKERSND